MTIIALYHWPWELLGDAVPAAVLKDRKRLNRYAILTRYTAYQMLMH